MWMVQLYVINKWRQEINIILISIELIKFICCIELYLINRHRYHIHTHACRREFSMWVWATSQCTLMCCAVHRCTATKYIGMLTTKYTHIRKAHWQSFRVLFTRYALSCMPTLNPKRQNSPFYQLRNSNQKSHRICIVIQFTFFFHFSFTRTRNID